MAHPAPPPLVPLKPLPAELLPAVSPALTAEALDVLAVVFNIYCADNEAQQQAALERHYSRHAVFEDNFLQVSGREHISAMYLALRRCCHHLDLALEKVELLPADGQLPGAAAEGEDQPELHELRLLGRHYFYLPHTIRGPVTAILLPPCLEVWTTDVLTVSGQRVLHHQQRVHNFFVLPWLVRWWLGRLLCLLLIHVLGW